MSQCVLHVMDVSAGHNTMKYNGKNKKELKKMVDLIMEKVSVEKFTLYGANVGEDYVKLFDSSDINRADVEKELEEKTRFMLREGVKLLLAPPVAGG